MSTTIAAEEPLINNTQFLEELERLEHVPDPELDSHSYADAFDALERGLPMDPAAREASAFDALERGLPMDPSTRETHRPHHERSPLSEPYETPVEHPALAEKHVPFLAAVLVLVACLTAGAATAALVFHDRVTQITALLANR